MRHRRTRGSICGIWRSEDPKKVPRNWCAPLPTKPGPARASRLNAQVGQARLAMGRGWGWGSVLADASRAITLTPLPSPPPPELGFTRVRHLVRPKSDISDFGWGREHTEFAARWEARDFCRERAQRISRLPGSQGGRERIEPAAPARSIAGERSRRPGGATMPRARNHRPRRPRSPPRRQRAAAPHRPR
jgi:hypothetical protein